MVIDDLHTVVLAGGSGTRFWPASRRLTPKQLLPLAPGSDISLLAATVRRIEPLCRRDHILIATGAHLKAATQAAVPELPEAAVLAEPRAKNTAPCIGWATAIVARENPSAVIMVLPSDQHVADVSAFHQALRLAVDSARTGTLTTIGLKPERPETGYGYIEAAEADGSVRRVARFVEKPERNLAETFVESGCHYWNSGMFFFRADTMLSALQRHLPQLSEQLERVESAAKLGREQEALAVERFFDEAAPVSIDYGVIEHLDELAVVPADFGWSDLGSWQTSWELSDKDARGNVADADAVLIDASGNLSVDLSEQSPKKVVALLGVDDLCVVQTDDVLLVMPRARSQDVRDIVDALKRSARDQLL